MPAKNLYHQDVIHALTVDGWTITDDPLRLTFGSKDLFVDLGAERAIVGAERGAQRIAVEIQSFLNRSAIRDLEEAVGQHEVYRLVLAESDPGRSLFLAIPKHAFDGIFSDRFGQMIISRLNIRCIVFEDNPGRIIQWIP